ncbi:autotransporter assembly complex family protein [Bowmanella sp. JS7-9]|uniref:Translocation and assembly module subunit TamA n=1 Tax=Pseudobowmanella zhangzhouensis TaxID=1537679 RepID=A0ABW1XMP1_9ALTE|nr:autotransporter assembly complex family protein [Bowmanella sp. JS7-9]
MKVFRRLFITSWLCFSSLAWAQTVSFELQGAPQGPVADNIRAYLQGMDVPLSGYSRFSDQVKKACQQAMQVYGYYEPLIEPERIKDDQWRVKITPGAQVLLAEPQIRVTTPDLKQSAFTSVIKEFNLRAGKPLNQVQYEKLKTALQTRALTLGYFDFQFSQSEIRVNLSEQSAQIILLAESGPRYRIGEIRMPEDEIALELIGSLQPLHSGDVYSVEKLAEFNNLLRETGYFQRVLVRPIVAEAKNAHVPLEVNVTHKPRDNFDVGGGVSSDDEGPRFRLKWRRPWVNPFGHSMGAEIFASQKEQNLAVDYRLPLEDAAKNYASFQFGYQVLHEEDTVLDKFTLGAQRHWQPLDADWQRIAFLRLERETFSQANEPEQVSNLLIPGLTLSRYRHRGGLDMDWGDRQTLTVELAADDVYSDINMLRITANSRWLRSIDEHRFVWRFEAGAIATNEFDQVPSSLRFFAGGDQSVRGFRYRSLSPTDAQGDLTGGRYLAVASVEYSYPVTDSWRAAVFVDAGSVSNKFAADPAIGAGIGAIWLSPVGPVRVYLGRGKNDIDTYTRLHITMGPAL